MSYLNQFVAVSTRNMRPILVGVVGGAGTGKKNFSALLASLLRKKSLDAVEIDYNNAKQNVERHVLPTADCILYHGLTVFEDSSLRPKLDVKVFLDMDADLRLANTNKSSHPITDIVVAHDFHVQHVLKQKKLADIWVDYVTQEKLEHVADVIAKARHTNQNGEEPKEIEVYLDTYNKAPDVPIPGEI